MEKEFLTFDGLYYQKNPNVDENRLISEQITKICSLFNFKIKPHIHTKFYQILFIENGQGDCIINNKTFKLNKRDIIIIPCNFIHSFYWGTDIEGRMLSVLSNFMDNLLEDNPEILGFFNEPQITDAVEKSVFSDLLNLIDKIDYDLFNHFPGKQKMISFKTGQLLIEIFRNIVKEDLGCLFVNNYDFRKFNIFKKKIRENFGKNKSIADYAKNLEITTIKLNRICHKLMGKPANGVINDYIISEAKIMLLYTDNTISEISYKLNFSSHNYFTRFFNKHIGLSPKQFRQFYSKADLNI